LRWKFPAAYEPFQWSRQNRIERIILRVALPSSEPAMTLPQNKRIPFFTEVHLRPLVFEEFTDRMNRRLALSEATGRSLLGREIYQWRGYPKRDPTQYHDTTLVPKEPGKSWLRCLVRPGMLIEQSLPSACTVVSNLDELLEVEYQLPYSALGDLDAIEQRLLARIRTFLEN
jgi:hypothetical protein